jgi:hypothetical protein
MYLVLGKTFVTSVEISPEYGSTKAAGSLVANSRPISVSPLATQ